ncbi:MAG: SUMF1/EgtB/PvdO family nonheme iron enzyme [Planctomycetes bacterium]|nr:SUMF1/EgtB/PvdO family nonheme iron enzyme [Planctomycetota bacterium]
MLTEIEQAFGENLILTGAVPGPHLAALLLRREQDPRPLWELAQELRVAPDAALAEAKGLAEAALAALGPQAFSFSEGAMIGPWELLQQRGQGPGGDCWFARLSTNTQQVATVRLVPPGTGDDPGRHLRWVERSNAGLEPPHPSLLKVDEAEEDFGWLYAATIGFDGHTLQAVRAQGPLPELSALALAQSLAGSLAVVHDLGVVHGGVNPLGVLLAEQRIYLSDFGLSSTLLDGPLEGSRPGGRLGALLFSSPGLVQGDAPRGLDARDDLFSLGALVCWAVCRAAPGEPRAAPGGPWLFDPPVSAGFKGVLARLLSPRSDGCYPTARAVLADLQRVGAGAMPGGLPPLAGPPVRGRRAPTAVPQRPVRPAPPRPALSASSSSGERPPIPPTIDDATPIVRAPQAPRPATPSGRQRKPSERVGKAKPKAPAPAPRRRAWGESAGAQARRGSGWLVFAGSLAVVVGGLVGGTALSAPTGKELGRVRLAQAERLLRASPVAWAEALGAIDEAVAALAGDHDLLRQALVRRDEVLARAAAERLEALPAGLDAAPEQVQEVADRLQDLRERARGLPVARLIDLDLARAQEKVEARTWIDLGTELIALGEPAAAVIATQRSGRGVERQLAEQASAMSYVPGGPYLLPRAQGEGLELVTRQAVYLGRQEVSRAEYRRFLAALPQQERPHATCDPGEPADKDHRPEGWAAEHGPDGALPATGVDHWDATAYARWRGCELPDVATLVAAARGRAARRFPWGDVPPALGLSNVGGLVGALSPGGAWPASAGAGGALDLVGNAEEWAATGEARQAPVFGAHHATPLADVAAAPGRDAPLTERRPERGFRVMKKIPGL